MPTVFDFFGPTAAFTATSLTDAINVVPNDYGRLRELNLFPGEPITTTSVAVVMEKGTLNLLPTRERGAPASLGMPEKRSAKQFGTFHIPHEDFVRADDVQNIVARVADPDMQMEQVGAVVNRKLARMRRKHGITLEHLRMGALRGNILDSDGSSLLNLYSEFGVTQKLVNFALGTAGTNVAGKAREVVGYQEDNLMGETMTGGHVLASPEFFEAFISHPKVEEVYKYYDGDNNPLRQDVRRGFPYHGLTIEEYRGSAQYLQEDGTYATRRFVPAGEAIAFPLGTTGTFATYFAPADFMDAVNTFGEEIYAREAMDLELMRWVKLHTQSNPLPLCRRPQLVVRLTNT